MIKILLVDDERPIVEWLEYTIRSLNVPCEIVGTCTNGADATALYWERHPDVVITDIKMPILDGIAFLRNICPVSDCYVIVLSNYDTFSYARETLTLGASEFILKTEIDSDCLGRLLERAQGRIAQRRLSRADMRNNAAVTGLLSDLAEGVSVDAEKCRGIFQANGVSLEDTQAYFTLLYCPADQDASRSMPPDLMNMPGIASAHLFALGNNRHIVLVYCVSPDDPGVVERLALAFQQTVQVQIGVSRLLAGWENLGKSVRQSQKALQFSFFCDDPVLHFHNQMLTDAHSLDTYYDSVVRCISEDDWQEAGAVTCQAFQYLDEHPCECTRKYVLSFVQAIGSAVVIARIPDKRNYQALTRQINSMTGVVLGIECVRDARDYVFSLFREQSRQQDACAYSFHIARAVRYIRQNFTHPVALQDLTTLLGLSAEYFCRLFKKETGKTLTQYLNDIRIQYAMSLLRNTNHTVGAICERCGFNSINYFNAQFKRFTDVQPTFYRKRCFHTNNMLKS